MTDEITSSASLPESPEPSIGQRRALANTGRQIRHGPLMPWMQAYAEWLCLECVELPTTSSRRVGARRLSHAPVSNLQLKLLEEREDFIAYCDALRAGPLEQARAKFISAFPTYIAAHREALDLATSAGDYAAMARIAEPVLDRVVPKKAEGTATASVVIHLSAGQAIGLQPNYAPPTLAVEEVIAEVVPDDA